MAPNRISRTEFNNFAEEVPLRATHAAWWPIWAGANAFETRELVIADGRTVEISDWKSERRKFTVGEGVAANLRVATFYYPYWRASVNGQIVEVNKDENGAITLPISKERSEVDLRFEEPFLYTVACWMSVAAWIILLSMIFRHISFGATYKRSD